MSVAEREAYLRDFHAKVPNDFEPHRDACACGLDMPDHEAHVERIVSIYCGDDA